MRAHEPTARNKATGMARARMLMKGKLGWLSGYPEGDGWMVVPEDGERTIERLALGRDHLRRATYTANELRREYPRALPALVGDVDAWHRAVGCVLEALKPWVHHGEPPPAGLLHAPIFTAAVRRRAAALQREHPALHGLVDALSWVLATRASLAGKALAWVEREAGALTVVHAELDAALARSRCVELVHLALAVGAKPMAPLMRLVGEAAVYRVPTHGAVEHLTQASGLFEAAGRGVLPPEPKLRLPGALAELARWLLARDPTTAKRCLALLDGVDAAPLVATWEQWWAGTRRLVARAHAIRTHQPDTRERVQRLAALRTKALARRQEHPGEVELQSVLAALRNLATRLGDGHASACRILARLCDPSLAPLRAGLVLQWSDLLHDGSWWNPRRMPPLLRALHQHLRQAPITPARLAPWREHASSASKGWGCNSFEQYLLEEGWLEVADIERFFEVLRRIETRAPAVALDTVARAAIRQLAVVHDAELATALVLELHGHGAHTGWIDGDTLRAAWRLCDPEPAGYAAIVGSLRRIEEHTELAPMVLVDTLMAAVQGDRALLRALLLDDDHGALLRCGRKLAVLHALGEAVEPYAPGSTASRAWIEAYPAAFHDDLAWLCAQTEEAEAIAAKLLRSIHRDRSETDAQRRAIAALLADAPPERRRALEARLRTLEQRFAEPHRVPSPAKLERLRAKLRRRGALERLRVLEARADARLPEVVGRALKLPLPLPVWAIEERVLMLLVPLRAQPPAVRQLARTLFHARTGSPPWDMREHPANARFLAGLAERGIDLRPWLDGIGPITTDDGAMTLALEDDPLEIFHMGRHFGTCLSPGQCNFFSVFANAADVNKRVLYARDARGVVMGRRLLCLTQEGALLAFDEYCHDRATGFAERSAEFVRRLAEAMGTAVVSRGVIPLLVAPDWYDDGAADLGGRLPALAEGSELRAALREASPTELPTLLSAALGQPKLDEATAPAVIALPEILRRPELAPALLSLVRRPERLPQRECLWLAWQLVHAGAPHRAREALTDPITRALMQQHRTHGGMQADALELLARIDPSRALALLRRTRDPGVRRWDHEMQADRLLAAGQAMEGLRRLTQAARMYRLAVAAGGHRATTIAAKERLRTLEPEAGRAAAAPR